MKLIKYLVILSTFVFMVGVTSIHAKSIAKSASLSVNPDKYSVSAGSNTLDVTFDVVSPTAQYFEAEIAVGGNWWAGGFAPAELAPGVSMTNMYCDWWGCKFWVQGVSSSHPEVIMHPSHKFCLLDIIISEQLP